MAKPTARIVTGNDELITVRGAMRSLNRFVDALERGEADKYVLMKGSRMVGVLVSLSTFEQLTHG